MAKTKKKAEKSIVGDLINFRGLVYSPLNENGVIFLFGKVVEDLNMYIEEIKPGFPDCIARRFVGKGWERVAVEFEYKSSNFKAHKHDHQKCDVIICWKHDWADCPIEVIELKDRIKELDNRHIKKPDDIIRVDPNELKNWFQKYKVNKTAQKLFDELIGYIKNLDESCFYKTAKTAISVYCPERVFLYFWPRKTMLRVNMFTQGKKLGKVKQFDFQNGGEKWGGLSHPDRQPPPLRACPGSHILLQSGKVPP
jgi:hypothetical protein